MNFELMHAFPRADLRQLIKGLHEGFMKIPRIMTPYSVFTKPCWK